MNKQELRKKYKKLRSGLSEEEIDQKSLAIANQLLKMKIWEFENYHIFLPITAQKEVNTEFIMHILQGKDKNIIVSKSDFSDNSMQHFLLTDNTKLKTNAWGIPEPEDGITINSKSIDLDDRFLEKAQPKKVIGLSFFSPEKAILGINNTDIAMDFCVLPDKIYDFI